VKVERPRGTLAEFIGRKREVAALAHEADGGVLDVARNLHLLEARRTRVDDRQHDDFVDVVGSDRVVEHERRALLRGTPAGGKNE